MSSHPAYHELARRYRVARNVWRDNPNVQRAAATIGMSEREYCDRYIAMYPALTWTSNSVLHPLSGLDCDTAFEDAAVADKEHKTND